MDLHLKQCRNQHESEQQHSTKMPMFLLPEPHQQQQSPASFLPLFVSEPNSKVSTLLSASSDSALDSSTTTTFPPVGSYFSIAQWQELELQTLIFRYMLAGAAVPPELLRPIKKSLLHSPPYFLNHQLQHIHPALLQSSYWGRAAMDPEPDRCRRTDGKKWRCSREVVAGQKYCERHVHRGRNRSRKPVELPKATSATGGSLASTSSSYGRSYGIKNDSKSLLENQDHVNGDGKSGGRILRPFFNDWPRSSQDPDNSDSIAGRINSATHLSMSKPGSTSSDVSLKLFTAHAETKKW